MRKTQKTDIENVPTPAPEQSGAGVTPPKRRLNSIDGCVVHLRWAIEQAEHGKLDTKLLNGLAAALNVLSGLIADSDLERRLSAMEKKYAAKS